MFEEGAAMMPCSYRFALLLLVAAGGRLLPAAEVRFEKIVLTDRFHAEAAGLGDIDGDGHGDAIYGPFWYAGPSFTERFPIYPPEDFDPHKYSNNFATFIADVDADSHPDVLVNVWPGKEVAWFKNPGTDVRQAGGWQRQLAFPAVDNESPTYADISGDGRGELCFHTGGVLGFAGPGDPSGTDRWPFTACSEKEDWQRYTHGLGVGDVNGDGRADFLMASGWWEQPAEPSRDPWTKHAVDFGSGGAQMHVADIDGDGDGDVVTSLAAHRYGLAWFEQVAAADGGISFNRHLILPATAEQSLAGVQFSQPHAVAVADINADGLPDIITGKRYWAHGPKGDPDPGGTPVLYWFELVRDSTKQGAEAVSFTPHLIDDASGVGTQLATGDLNGDGRLDLVVGNKRGGFVFRQQSGQ
jgi:hypothetical protein